MNIKITYNWLCEYLDTDATAYDLQKYLSLCGPAIERVDKVGDDYVLDIEVTTNRIDMASVFGIAQEASAILPQFGKKAVLKFNPLQKYTFDNLNAQPAPRKQLKISIENPELCPRFTAIVVSNIAIKHAPEIIASRLQMCDIKSINNIVDISNYLMLALGQPTHMFDYDKIAKQTMIMRESKKGEKIVTLDDKELILPGGDIVMEDGDGRLFDLCGVMGGASSAISAETENVIFFVQTYDKRHIRKTSMTTGQRTVAATYFEKGLDTQRVETTITYGIELLGNYTEGILDSQLYDIYHHPYTPKHVTTYLSTINRMMGVELKEDRVESILKNLGFDVETSEEEGFAYPDSVKFQVTVPSYRRFDVEIKEDIVEEVARVYGYHNLPNVISPMVYVRQPRDIEQLFVVQHRTKLFLQHLGLNEVMNFSMISKNLIEKLDLLTTDHLKLDNTISEEIEYMRNSLTPSLLKNMQDNQGKKDELKFFEISRVYLKNGNDLPHEEQRLGIVVDTDFFDLKGIVEATLTELHIGNVSFKKSSNEYFHPQVQADVFIGEEFAGTIGQVKLRHQQALELKKPTFVAAILFEKLIQHAKILADYAAPSTFATVKLDLTFTQRQDQSYAQIQKTAFDAAALLRKIEVVDIFKDHITIRFYFAATDRNITEAEAKQQLARIEKAVI